MKLVSSLVKINLQVKKQKIRNYEKDFMN